MKMNLRFPIRIVHLFSGTCAGVIIASNFVTDRMQIVSFQQWWQPSLLDLELVASRARRAIGPFPAIHYRFIYIFTCLKAFKIISIELAVSWNGYPDTYFGAYGIQCGFPDEFKPTGRRANYRFVRPQHARELQQRRFDGLVSQSALESLLELRHDDQRILGCRSSHLCWMRLHGTLGRLRDRNHSRRGVPSCSFFNGKT